MSIPDHDLHADLVLVVYSSREEGAGSGVFEGGYVEVFPIVKRDKKRGLTLGAGKPLDKETARGLAASISSGLVSLSDFGLLPERILGVKVDGGIAWWRPAGAAPFRAVEQMKIPSGEACYPSLLFALTEGHLHVMALKGGRPGPKGQVYEAPVWNWYSSGMCMGTARLPDMGTAKERMDTAENAFFQSSFSSHASGGRTTSTDKAKLWTRLVRTGKPFPERQLQAANTTVSAWLGGLGF